MTRQIVIPGEIIVSGEDFLPGEGTEKQGENIIALRYGLSEETSKLVKVIPLSGSYKPRRGNVLIGKVEMLTRNGWVIDIGNANNAFLPLMEVPKFVDKGALQEVMDIGDMVVVKIFSIRGRDIDLTIKSRGLGKIEEGIIFKINPNKVPRVIGKEGSMINLIKDKTGCNVTVGQNGFVLVEGNNIDNEVLARESILYIAEKSLIKGLTDEVTKFFEGKEKKE